MREKCCSRIREERQRHQNEDLLGDPVGAAHHEQPDDHRSDRDRHVLRDVCEREGGADTDELADADAEVRHQHRGRRERRPPDAVLLANQLGEALARHRPHACRHLLDDDQRHRDQDHHPDQVVAVPGADCGVSGDPAGVVTGVRRDQAGAENSEESEKAGGARVTRPQARTPGEGPVAQRPRGATY